VKCSANGEIEIQPGATKVPRIKVRNQNAIPVFTNESLVNEFVAPHESVDLTIGKLPDVGALREWIMVAASDDRFIFDPVEGERPLPSYAMDTVLSSLGTS